MNFSNATFSQFWEGRQTKCSPEGIQTFILKSDKEISCLSPVFVGHVT